MSCRGMNKEAEERQLNLIASFCCNIPDLYGVVRADDALISRLVIIEMLECCDKQAFHRFTQKYDPSTPSFKYSLDQWLLKDFVIPEDFRPCRYYSSEKYEFVKQAKQSKSNSLEQWLSHLLTDCESMFQSQTFKQVPYRTINQSTANRLYKDYMSGKNQVFSEQNVIQLLIEQGFEQCKIHGTRLLRISTQKFDELRDKYDDGIPELIPDDDVSVEYM
jgi:hypothetical protein